MHARRSRRVLILRTTDEEKGVVLAPRDRRPRTMSTDDRPAAPPPAWDGDADEVLVEGLITAALALIVIALVRMLTCYLWSTSQSDVEDVDDSKTDALPPLPPLAEQPWFKKEPGWYVDRWRLVGESRRATRPIRFVVLAPGAAATEADVLHLTLVRHGQGVHNVLAEEALARGDTRPPYSAARLAELPHMVRVRVRVGLGP